MVGHIGLGASMKQALDESLPDIYTNGRKDKEPATGIAAKSFDAINSLRRKLCLLCVAP
jgi:hypothetical protein